MHQLHLAEIVLEWSRSFWTLEKSATIRGAYFSLLNVTKSVFSNKVQKCINHLIWYTEVKIQFYKYLMNELNFYTVVMLLRYALSIIFYILLRYRAALCASVTVTMHECLGKHSCMSSTFSIAILNYVVLRQCNYQCTTCIRSEKLEIVKHV